MGCLLRIDPRPLDGWARVRLATAAIVVAAAGCRTPLSDGTRYQPAGPPERLGLGYSSFAVVRGSSLLFSAERGGPGGVEWNARLRTLSSREIPFYATRSPEGSLVFASLTEPGEGQGAPGSFSVKIESTDGVRRLFASREGNPEIAVSPPDENVQGFGFARSDRGLCLTWTAAAKDERIVRVAMAEGDGVPRSYRIPFDGDRPYLTSPSISPIGLPREAAVVVAYAAAPSSVGASEVRIARIAPGDDGLVRVGAAKPVSTGFVWSRRPQVRAHAKAGVVVFEGLALEGDVPAIFATALSPAGDPVGYPQFLMPIREAGVTRSNATPHVVSGEWFLAYEEQLDGDPSPALLVRRLVAQ